MTLPAHMTSFLNKNFNYILEDWKIIQETSEQFADIIEDELGYDICRTYSITKSLKEKYQFKTRALISYNTVRILRNRGFEVELNIETDEFEFIIQARIPEQTFIEFLGQKGLDNSSRSIII